MLRWTISIDDNVDISHPTNCFEHIAYAYRNEDLIKAKFEFQANRASDLQSVESGAYPNACSLGKLCEEEYACSVISVDLSPPKNVELGWYINRVFIPNALPRMSGLVPRESIIDRLERSEINIREKAINLSPHPFG